MLHAWEELPHDAIAEIVGMTRAAVDQRIHRSLKRLSRVLQPVVDGPAPIARPLSGGSGR